MFPESKLDKARRKMNRLYQQYLEAKRALEELEALAMNKYIRGGD